MAAHSGLPPVVKNVLDVSPVVIGPGDRVVAADSRVSFDDVRLWQGHLITGESSPRLHLMPDRGASAVPDGVVAIHRPRADLAGPVHDGRRRRERRRVKEMLNDKTGLL